MQNNGKMFEDQMVYLLNVEKYSDLHANFKKMMVDLYGVIDPDEPVSCEYGADQTKPDIVITHMGKKKYVSIKTGKAVHVHREQLSMFIPFLRFNGISEDTLRTILLFCYGDGTVNGTGKERMDTNDLKYWLKDRIKAANKELNQSADFIIKVMERVLFQGIDPNAIPANAIYHGDLEYGVTVVRKQVEKHIRAKKWNVYDALHIGPFFIRPHARYVGKEVKNETYRSQVDINWPNMRENMEYVAKKYSGYTPIRYRTYEE